MILVRNPNWDPASDPYRTALPDRWELNFGIAGAVIDQRLIASAGNDQYAIPYGGTLQTENLAVVFSDPSTPVAQFAGRAVSEYDIYARYYWINVNKVPNVKIRQAMAVALDREALRLNAGGDFYGGFADGFIKPNIGQDYAPTGFWTEFFGQAIPDSGDPELALQLIEDSGEAAPSLTFDYADTATNGRAAAIVVSSLARAGITVTPNPIEPGKYYSIVFDPAAGHEFGISGWGADWPNASTVIPPLFTPEGGFDLSAVDDPDFNARVEAAQSETNRATQATLWQALNKHAVENVYAIPTFFGFQQRLAGTKIGNVYFWGPYGSWPYGDMYVLP
jgi:peptide/nickel transport system substrate-binding protein